MKPLETNRLQKKIAIQQKIKGVAAAISLIPVRVATSMPGCLCPISVSNNDQFNYKKLKYILESRKEVKAYDFCYRS